MNRVKLLSPAGSFESLQAAIQAGTDAVYFGVEQLNMRAKSSGGLTLHDLSQITSLCRSHQIKTYLTLNTVMYDHDITLMKKIMVRAKDEGVDAIIASDHAVLMHAKLVGIPIHISTQANVSNIEAVSFYSSFADTIVLARELSLQQIESMTKQIRKKKIKGPSGELINIEVFAHGALCMAISGKCYLSLHSHLSSANRGACVQNCRRPYLVKDQEEGIELEIDHEYIMSAKDLCTISFIDKLIEAGVSMLKIEGRGRSADYVYTTTKCYREAISSYYEGTYDPTRIEQWKKELTTVFNRGFWDGYYLGKKMGEWTDEYGSKASRRKIYMGHGIHYFTDKKVAQFKLETGWLEVGQTIMVIGPSTGVIEMKVKELRVDDIMVDCVRKGDTFSVFLGEKIRPRDKLYKVVDVA